MSMTALQALPTTRTNAHGLWLAALVVVALLSGCATSQNVRQVDRLDSIGENARILLMPPDIRYYLITAGGMPEPHAEWTRAARDNFAAALRDHAARSGTALVMLDDTDMTPAQVRYSKLHEVVGYSVLIHHFGYRKLPTKQESFDWSLGPGVAAIAEDHGADYGLFVFYRDEQASGGRVAFAVLAAVAGAAVSTGGEYGFASLVDLRTGDVVWFNVVTAGSGELRDPAGAGAAVETLFRDMPTGDGPTSN